MKKNLMFVAAVMAISPLSAMAGSFDGVNNQISLEVGQMSQRYGEYNDEGVDGFGKYLDTEKGTNPTVGLTVAKTFDNYYTAFSVGYSKGDTGYTGGVQDLSTGAVAPATATTENKVLDLGAKLGYVVPVASNFQVIPHVDLGYHKWDRAIGMDTDAGVSETYKHYRAGLGVIAQYAPIQPLVLSANAMYGTTFGSDMEITSFDAGHKFELGKRATYVFGLGADYAVAKDWHVKAGLNYNRFGYGASDIDANGWYEPRSSTIQTSYNVGVGYSF